MHVGQRRALRQPDVPVAPQRPGPGAGHDDRQVERVVRVAVAHAGPVDDHRLIEQRPVAVRRRPQLLQEAPEDLHVERVDLGQLDQLLLAVAVVRDGVVRLRDPDLGVGAHALLAADQEGADAGQVGLPGDQHQVEHQVGVLLEVGGDAGRLLDLRQPAAALRLGDLDAPLDVADRIEVPGQLRAVAAAELPLQVGDLGVHRVEDALVPAQRPRPRGRLGAVDGAEQVLEHRARVGLHRQRRVRVAPGDGGAVGAAVAVLALPHQLVGLQRQLQRSELRVFPQLARRELVHRHAHFQGAVGPRRLHRVGAREVGRLAPRVVAVALVEPLLGLLVGHAAQHQQLVLHRGQRRQDRGHLEPPLGGRQPAGHAHAVRHVDGAEPPDRPRRGVPDGGERRHHAVEQRERDARSETPQHRAARQRLLRDDHRFSSCPAGPGDAAAIAARPPPRPRAPGAVGTADFPRFPEPATTSGGRRTPRRAGWRGRPACRSAARAGRGRRSEVSR